MTKLSPEAQACYNEVKQSSENQRQSLFERACQKIKDKTQIALLAAMLWLWLSQAPNTVQAGEPQRIETEANSIANNPEYKRLLATLDVEFPKLLEQWKKEVTHENQAKFENWMWTMRKRLSEWTIALKGVSMFERMVDKNGAFYINFHNYVAQFESFAEIRTKERRENIEQMNKNIKLMETLSSSAKNK